ncbi:MAG: sulfotransferase [Rhodobacteraceae bacterium]|nr:sulfotransferase [Paracoccaceae bacterium]
MTMATPVHDWPEGLERVVLCIGAPKAATTFLYVMLRGDPRVCVSKTKEVHFWDVASGINSRLWQKRALKTLLKQCSILLVSPFRKSDLTWRDIKRSVLLLRLRWGGLKQASSYIDYLLSDYQQEKVVFEASPGYSICDAGTLAQMGRVHENTHLVLMVRDPVQRLWSDTRHRLRPGIKAGKVQREEVLQAFERDFSDPGSFGYRNSDYASIISRLEEAGLGGKLWCVFYENITDERERSVLKSALGFEPELTFSERVNVGQDITPSPELMDRAKQAFGHVYEYMYERYGSRVPSNWLA